MLAAIGGPIVEALLAGVGVFRYADLCGIPHKSAYADWRIMPTVA